jgi:hypothetical protein
MTIVAGTQAPPELQEPTPEQRRMWAQANSRKGNAILAQRRAKEKALSASQGEQDAKEATADAKGVPARKPGGRKPKRAPDLSTRAGRIQALEDIVNAWYSDDSRAPEAKAALSELLALHGDAQAIADNAQRVKPEQVCAWIVRQVLAGRSLVDAMREGVPLRSVARAMLDAIGCDGLRLDAGQDTATAGKLRDNPQSLVGTAQTEQNISVVTVANTTAATA